MKSFLVLITLISFYSFSQNSSYEKFIEYCQESSGKKDFIDNDSLIEFVAFDSVMYVKKIQYKNYNEFYKVVAVSTIDSEINTFLFNQPEKIIFLSVSNLNMISNPMIKRSIYDKKSQRLIVSRVLKNKVTSLSSFSLRNDRKWDVTNYFYETDCPNDAHEINKMLSFMEKDELNAMSTLYLTNCYDYELGSVADFNVIANILW